jgi:hypothetical protein
MMIEGTRIVITTIAEIDMTTTGTTIPMDVDITLAGDPTDRISILGLLTPG